MPSTSTPGLAYLVPAIMAHDSSAGPAGGTLHDPKAADRVDELDANIRNFAPVARIMKNALPDNAKIAKEAKECMQECVSEFISFITSEGTLPCPPLRAGEALPPRCPPRPS